MNGRTAMRVRTTCALMALCVLMGCEPFTPEAQQAVVEANHYVAGDYKIGAEDVIEVIVWRNADLTKTVAVRPDGKISLPLIGDVMALGKTAAELTKEISAKLKEYKENPNVSVVVQQVNSYIVYVLGEVVHPGRYALKSYSTVLQAISLAGGFTPYASKDKMFLLRKAPDRATEIRIPVDYEDLVAGDGSAKNAVLVPGDTVVVP